MAQTIHLKNSLSIAIVSLLQATVPALLSGGSLLLCAWLLDHEADRFLIALALVAVVVSFLVLRFPSREDALDFTQSSQIIGKVTLRWIAIFLALLAIGILSEFSAQYPADVITAWAIVTPVSLIIALSALNRLKRRLVVSPKNARSAVFAGWNIPSRELSNRLLAHPELCVSVLGFFDDRAAERLEPRNASVPELGNLADIPRYVRENRVQVIFISLPMRHVKRVMALLDDLRDTTASIYYVPDLFVFDLIQSHTGNVMGVPIVSMCESPLFGNRGVIKRCSDVAFTLGVLTFALPVMLLCALAIRVSSSGPVIFRQRRYGLDGHEFIVYKFRTMKTTEDGAVIRQASIDDPRITTVGKFLRRYSLDELPQLINVLQGRMSLVGPRPHAVAHNEEYRSQIKGYMLRHKVLPGITGLAQVNGCRGETRDLAQMEARVRYDLEYLRRWTPVLDFKILAMTVVRMISDKNAY